MQEPYGEGLASPTGPKSCAGGREAVGEALTGEDAGAGAPSLSQKGVGDALLMHGGTAVRAQRPTPAAAGMGHPRMTGWASEFQSSARSSSSWTASISGRNVSAVKSKR